MPGFKCRRGLQVLCFEDFSFEIPQNSRLTAEPYPANRRKQGNYPFTSGEGMGGRGYQLRNMSWKLIADH
jgi:hypothetical protein